MNLETSDHRHMTSQEKQVAGAVGLVMSLRMLGLFMILPVFTLFAHSYMDMTEERIGLALGIYGLTQAVFQIPFGIASDIFGRRRVIFAGLCLFLLGSVVAACAESLITVIIGRALQGMGAVGSVCLALMADLTRPQHRTKAMAIIGMSIGASFSLAILLGAMSAEWINLSGMFWLTACFAVAAMAIVWQYLPSAPKQESIPPRLTPLSWQQHIINVIRCPELIKLDVGILLLHGILTALFVGMPVIIENLVSRSLLTHAWQLYLPVLIISLLLTAPLILFAEKYQKLKTAMVFCVMLLSASLLFLWEQNSSLAGCFLGLVLFFTAFNSLEAILPSMVSRVAPQESKGAAMSFYSLSQFMGIFLGGILGGWIYSSSYLNDIFVFLALVSLVWLLLAYNTDSPRVLGNYVLQLAPQQLQDLTYLHKKLMKIQGIEGVRVDASSEVAHLTIDRHLFDPRQIRL